jgi:hypothetical protein
MAAPTPRPDDSHACGTETDSGNSEFAAAADRIGERMRRVALGLFAALVTARPYWPSEVDPDKVSGSGLVWTVAVILVAGLAIAATLCGGKFRYRLSWTDLAVVTLMFLVGLSSVQGTERRLAINLAWEWAGLGFAFVLMRYLPRTRGESIVLAGALMATAVAISAYGIFQSRVEIPQLQAKYRSDPQAVLKDAKVGDDPRQIKAFEDRLGGREVFATFGLANSLACFLVGPLVLGLGIVVSYLADREASRAWWKDLLLGALPLLCLLSCLILTKSLSAWIGLLVGASILAWHARKSLSTRTLLVAAATGGVLVAVVASLAIAGGRLDRGLLTQAARSLRYRWEYWQGAWGVVTEGAQTPRQALGASTFWSGVGPGNFGPHYLLHKLPWSSEEIRDPHNLFLEVWATAGFWAVLALAAALGLAAWNLLGPAHAPLKKDLDKESSRKKPSMVSRETVSTLTSDTAAGPPVRLGWLLLSSAMGLTMVFLVGQFNLFQNDLLVRWLVMVAGWALAVLLGRGLCRAAPWTASAFGAAVLAIVVSLLASGGIGFQSVALCLWMLVALGLNLRGDRPCGRLHEVESRLPGFALALLWAALAGSFAGAVLPFWRCEAALAQADDALAHLPPNYERAQAAYEYAEQADRFNPRPWLGDAYLQLLIWNARGSRPEDLRWKKIPALILKAASGDRNPSSWTLHSERAQITRELLSKVGHSLTPQETITWQGSIVEASRKASLLYPTNATLHARLALASATIQMYQDAVDEAKEALRLDEITPHPDKKLTDKTREELKALLPEWAQKTAQFKVGRS